MINQHPRACDRCPTVQYRVAIQGSHSAPQQAYYFVLTRDRANAKETACGYFLAALLLLSVFVGRRRLLPQVGCNPSKPKPYLHEGHGHLPRESLFCHPLAEAWALDPLRGTAHPSFLPTRSTRCLAHSEAAPYSSSLRVLTPCCQLKLRLTSSRFLFSFSFSSFSGSGFMCARGTGFRAPVCAQSITLVAFLHYPSCRTNHQVTGKLIQGLPHDYNSETEPVKGAVLRCAALRSAQAQNQGNTSAAETECLSPSTHCSFLGHAKDARSPLFQSNSVHPREIGNNPTGNVFASTS